MSAQAPNLFTHTTLAVYPETHIGNGKYTPKVAGITLLDEKPGFTGIYLRDVNGDLWPARTVDRSLPDHYRSVCDAWLSRHGAEDHRKHKEPTSVDRIRGRLEEAGISVQMESDEKLIADPDGFYERFGSNECSHVGFEATDWGNALTEITVKCPLDFGGKTEKYVGETFDDGVNRIIEIFSAD